MIWRRLVNRLDTPLRFTHLFYGVLGATMTTQTALKVGGVYKMNHQRKGKATVKILEIGDPWIHVVLVEGSVKGIGAGSYRETGDELTVRDSLATFTEVE